MLTAPAKPPGKDLETEFLRLKKERNAILLAHYYQDSEIQDVADFIGDSLQLAQEAKKTQADVIVFAGVHFMAETAKILNPERVVVVPDMKAGCSLADGCPTEPFRAWKAKHPDSVTISYINCSAEVKAESDYICTSSNAKKIVNSIPKDRQILFAPDRNLGRYLVKETGRELVLWPGSCIVHETFSQRKIVDLKERNPGAKLISHPECEESLLELSDFHRLDVRAPQVRADGRRRLVHRRDRIRHLASNAARRPRQDLHPRPARGELRVQRVPVHAPEHDGKALHVSAGSHAAHRHAGRAQATGEAADRSDARVELSSFALGLAKKTKNPRLDGLRRHQPIYGHCSGRLRGRELLRSRRLQREVHSRLDS